MMTNDDAAMPAPTGSGTEDARLVVAYLDGDRSALGVIYDRHGASLFDTAAAMTGSRDDAADMVQDVFVLAAERLGQLRDPTRLRPWLFAILRNEVYRRSRRRARSVVTDFSAPEREVVLPASPPESDLIDDELDAAELAELVRDAARGLDARDQLVLELSVRQGLGGADLADALGVSAQQGYGLVHRMRERTERSLGAYCVARRGRRDCAELAGILTGWDGEFTVLLRKRVARHIEGCSTCERTRRKVLPLALVGSASAFAAPITLRDRIMEQVLAMSSSQASSSPDPGGSEGAPGVDPSTGFPILEAVGRSGRRVAAVLTGAAAGLLILGGLAITRGDPDTDVTAPVVDPAPTTIAAVTGSEVPASTSVGAQQPSHVVTTTERVTTTPPTEDTEPAPDTTTSPPVAVRPAGTTPVPDTTAPTTTQVNRAPSIGQLDVSCTANSGTYIVSVNAPVSDDDGDPLTVRASVDIGGMGESGSVSPSEVLVEGTGPARFTVTLVAANGELTVTVDDGRGGAATTSALVGPDYAPYCS